MGIRVTTTAGSFVNNYPKGSSWSTGDQGELLIFQQADGTTGETLIAEYQAPAWLWVEQYDATE